jgi:Tol biopolymer transport system component
MRVDPWLDLSPEFGEPEPPLDLRAQVLEREQALAPRSRWQLPALAGWAAAIAGVVVVVGLLALAAHSRLQHSPSAAGSEKTPGDLAFVSWAGGDPGEVSLVAPGGGPAQALTGASVTDAAWSADGKELVYARTVRRVTAGGRLGPSHMGVYVVRSGGPPRLIRHCPSGCYSGSFAWSPDGRQIAFVTNSVGNKGEIAVMNADGSGFHVVCGAAVCGQVGDPQWSPDGSKLLFTNNTPYPGFNPARPSRVWVANADGSDPHALTQPQCRSGHGARRGCADDFAASWSPNGQWIAFSRYPVTSNRSPASQATYSVQIMQPDGSDVHPIATCTGTQCNGAMQPAWSPEGTHIAYIPSIGYTAAPDDSRILITSLSGHVSTLHTCAQACVIPQSPITWAPNGRALAFLTGYHTQSVYVIPTTGGSMHRVASHAVWCCVTWLPASNPSNATQPAADMVVIPRFPNSREILPWLYQAGLRITIPTAWTATRGERFAPMIVHPTPGTKAPRASTVTLQMSTFGGTWTAKPGHYAVPNVDSNLWQALRQLNRADLPWQVHASPLPPTAAFNLGAAYCVTAQRPAPGTTIHISSASSRPSAVVTVIANPCSFVGG